MIEITIGLPGNVGGESCAGCSTTGTGVGSLAGAVLLDPQPIFCEFIFSPCDQR